VSRGTQRARTRRGFLQLVGGSLVPAVAAVREVSDRGFAGREEAPLERFADDDDRRAGWPFTVVEQPS